MYKAINMSVGGGHIKLLIICVIGLCGQKLSNTNKCGADTSEQY